MPNSEQLISFFQNLEQNVFPQHQLLVSIDTESLYHMAEYDGVLGRASAIVSSPKIENNVSIFGENIASIQFVHFLLIDVNLDEEDQINFGRIKTEDESDCYDPACEFPIHAKITYKDGSIEDQDLIELIGENEEDFHEICDVLKKIMPFNLLSEMIESENLKPKLTQNVLDKVLSTTAI